MPSGVLQRAFSMDVNKSQTRGRTLGRLRKVSPSPQPRGSLSRRVKGGKGGLVGATNDMYTTVYRRNPHHVYHDVFEPASGILRPPSRDPSRSRSSSAKRRVSFADEDDDVNDDGDGDGDDDDMVARNSRRRRRRGSRRGKADSESSVASVLSDSSFRVYDDRSPSPSPSPSRHSRRHRRRHHSLRHHAKHQDHAQAGNVGLSNRNTMTMDELQRHHSFNSITNAHQPDPVNNNKENQSSLITLSSTVKQQVHGRPLDKHKKSRHDQEDRPHRHHSDRKHHHRHTRARAHSKRHLKREKDP